MDPIPFEVSPPFRTASRLALAAAAVLASLALSGPAAAQATDPADPAAGPGQVFVLTNAPEANQVAFFNRMPNGALIRGGVVATGGTGTGSPLDSQGALTLSTDHQRLYACNPGSDTISVFRVNRPAAPRLLRVVPSGGDLPVSLTLHGDVLYVLNAGPGGTNITALQAKSDGTLAPLPGSTRELSTPVGAPAQVQFNTDGTVLVVTHKATDTARPPENIIDTFTIDAMGMAGPATPQRSNGLRPFGVAFRKDGQLVVAEAFNGVAGAGAASSYDVGADGSLTPISGSVGDGQTASCWAALNPTGTLAFVTNTPAGTLSTFGVKDSGALVLLNGTAALFGPDSRPQDVATSHDGGFLYVLLAGLGRVAAFRISHTGVLKPLDLTSDSVPGFSPKTGPTGLVAY